MSDISELLAKAKADWDCMSLQDRAAMLRAQRRSYMLGEAALGSDADEAAYAEAVAAGDKATMARLDAEAEARAADMSAYLDRNGVME